MHSAARIYVAGHRGMVGRALVRALTARGCRNLLLRTRDELDLTNHAAVDEFFARERPEYVFLAAARVGGILANQTRPADFIYDNLAIAVNVIGAAHRFGVTKLLNLGSSCIYPRLAPQPLREEYLLTGPLEPTNEDYAVAKIAAIKLCEAFRSQHGCNFISAMPTNLYGPFDNFDLQSSHVLPALIRKFHEARLSGAPMVEVWGTGRPRREFLYVDDLAEASLLLMESYDDARFVNVGSGQDHEIREIAELVARLVGFEGKIRYDTAKPDGVPQKLMDNSRLLALGWRPRTDLETGLSLTYRWFCEHSAEAVRAEAH
jgi:GDP-L-fucose synthase